MTTHFSNSCWSSFSCICRKRVKKSDAVLLHFWVLPLNKAQTFRARGHSHKMWLTVSDMYWQISQCGVIFTRRRWRLSRVGRQFEHALHINVCTFGGTFRTRLLFHTRLCSRAKECSEGNIFNRSKFGSLSLQCVGKYG